MKDLVASKIFNDSPIDFLDGVVCERRFLVNRAPYRRREARGR
jgi:hypothetical protein